MLIKKFNQYKIIQLLLFALLLWPPYITLKIGSFPGMSPERLLAFYFVFIWLVFYIYSSKFRKEIKSYFFQYHFLFYLIILLYLIQFISSILFSQNQTSAILNNIIKTINQPFLLLLVISFINKENVLKLIKLIIFIELIIIGLGVIESFLSQPLFSFATFLNESAKEAFNLGNFREDKYRIISTFSHSLVLALFVLLLLPFNHFFLKKTKYRIVPTINIIFTPIIIIFTDSRMGQILYLFFYLFFFLNKIYNIIIYKKGAKFFKKILFKFTIFFLVTGFVIFINNFETYINNAMNYLSTNIKETSSTSHSTMARLIQLNIAYENTTLLGFGSKGDTETMENYFMKAMDNYYVSILLKSGILGLLVYFFIAYYIFTLIIKHQHKYILSAFFYFFLNYYLYTLILSIDHLFSIFFIFLGFLLILLKKEKKG